MPIYEYKCGDCGERFEKLILNRAKVHEILCPKCQSEKVEKQISLFGTSGSDAASWSGPAASGCSPTGGT